MNDRLANMRSRVLNSRQLGDSGEAQWREESLPQTVGQPEVLREARALAYYCQHQDLVINEGELLVGTRPGLTFDQAARVVPTIFGRQQFGGYLAPADEPFAAFFRVGLLSWAGNHKTLDYERVFAVGLSGLLASIDKRLDGLNHNVSADQEKRDFLLALGIVAQGYIDLSNRYSDEALRLADVCADPLRKAELETIARNCQRVPAQPPTTFWEACQCAWFSFFMVPDAPGRVDQYLFPWYERDMQSGALTREFAKELLACLWLKYFESVGAASGVSAHNHLTLGGLRADGSDAANEVTVLCLEVTEELRVLRPQVGLRWHRHTPPALLKQAVRTLRAGTGNPDFCSDEQIVPALVRVGVRLEDARDFSLSGCHEVIVTGRAQMGSVEGFVNMPKVLRMTLGLEPGLQPDANVAGIDSFDALWQGLTRSLEWVAQMAHEASVYRDRREAQRAGGDLVVSLFTRDCIENARGYTQGGARYNFCNWDVIGIANLADSLAAIQHLVFERGTLTLAQFVAILATDWQGQEALRREIMSGPAHFGNDQQDVDEIAARVVATFSAILKRYAPFRGGEYILGTTAGGENMHIEFGRMTGATPDGRKANAPLADSLGAAQGRDRHGVTALLNSVARLPHQLLPTATTCNVKLDPRLLDTEAGLASIAALIEAHFRSGGQQLQFSMVDREMLLEAKRHPEQHADLMVRVSGYSAPFISLWADLQDEIIARTMHELSC
jgi:trans-4-hydroxy-L-proline dehydratase